MIQQDLLYGKEDKKWYIYGINLVSFHLYYPSNNLTESLFKYIKRFPQFIKEVEMLARYNNWLTEDQLILLTCANMFK
jgi:hypothetical protein